MIFLFSLKNKKLCIVFDYKYYNMYKVYELEKNISNTYNKLIHIIK